MHSSTNSKFLCDVDFLHNLPLKKQCAVFPSKPSNSYLSILLTLGGIASSLDIENRISLRIRRRLSLRLITITSSLDVENRVRFSLSLPLGLVAIASALDVVDWVGFGVTLVGVAGALDIAGLCQFLADVWC